MFRELDVGTSCFGNFVSPDILAILFQIFEFIGVDVKTIVVQPHTFGIMAAVVAGVFGSAGIPEILCAECIVGVFGAVGPVTGRKAEWMVSRRYRELPTTGSPFLSRTRSAPSKPRKERKAGRKSG